MSKFLKYALLLSLWAVSCHRQHIYLLSTSSSSASFEVVVDWSSSEMELSAVSNISIYAYGEDGGSPYLKISGDIDTAYLSLPVGIYTLLLLSDAVDDVAGVQFGSESSFEEFYARTIARSSTSDLYYTLQEGEEVAQSMGQVATWHTTEVEVTEEMVACNYCGEELIATEQITLYATPTTITTQCVVSIEVENLNNAAIIQATLQGLASGRYLASNTPLSDKEQTTLYSLEFSSRNYSNDTDGTTQCEITTFGRATTEESDEEQTYLLTIDIILNSGEKVTYLRDVTDEVETSDGTTIYISISGDDNKIVLPESSGTGFGVDSWGDNEPLELL